MLTFAARVLTGIINARDTFENPDRKIEILAVKTTLAGSV